MARVATFSKDEIVRANELRNHAKTVEEMQRALAVLLMAEGQMEAEKASVLLGISKRTLFRYRESFRHQDRPLRSAWGGRRHCLMSLEEERAFLSPWLEKARREASSRFPPFMKPSSRSWGGSSLPPPHIGFFPGMGGGRSLPIPSTRRVSQKNKRRLKKTPRNSGSRPHNPSGLLSGPSSFSGRGPIRTDDRPPCLLGSRSPPPGCSASLGAGIRL